MQSFQLIPNRLRRKLRIVLFLITALIFLWYVRDVVIENFFLIAGASVICFLLNPLVRIFEKRFSRNSAALCALASCLGILIIGLCLLLPALVSQSLQLIRTVPHSVTLIKSWISEAGHWLQKFFPGFQIKFPALSTHQLPNLAKNTFQFAGSLANLCYRVTLTVVLSYCFMCDKERLLLRLELLIPYSARRTAIRMGNAVCRELHTYLRSQGIISAAVGALTALGLTIVGLDSAIILGFIVGLLNMIPYFGPLIGAIPAVLSSLGNGYQATAMTIAVLWLVQQIDGTLLSPRIMSSQTGISPAIVLLSVFVGSGLGGIVGMLFAMPIIMSLRTVFRVFVQRYENV